MLSRHVQPKAGGASQQQAVSKAKQRPQVKLNVCSSNKSKITISGRASYLSNSSVKHLQTPNHMKQSGFCYPKAISVQHGPLDNHQDFPDESKLMNEVLENIVRKEIKNKYPPLPPRTVNKRDCADTKATTPSEAGHRYGAENSFKLGKTSSVGMLKKNFSHKSLAHFTQGSRSPAQKFAFNLVQSPQQAAKESGKWHSPAPNKQKLLSEHVIEGQSPAASKESDYSAPSSSQAKERQHPPSKFRIKVNLCPKPVH